MEIFDLSFDGEWRAWLDVNSAVRGSMSRRLFLVGGQVGGLLIDADDETRRAAIRCALAGGINWIDTAPQYGGGKSETAARLVAGGGRGQAQNYRRKCVLRWIS